MTDQLPMRPRVENESEERVWRHMAILRQLRGNKVALCALLVTMGVTFAALFPGLLAPYEPNSVDYQSIRQAPSGDHWFGTDLAGRDVYTRVIYGSRVSVAVVAITISTSLVIGALLGLIAGYVGGWVDSLLSRITDGMLAIPELVLALALVAVLGPSLINTSIALTLLNIPQFARIVRADTLALRHRPFVAAGRMAGSAEWRVVKDHILPHVMGTLLVFAALRSAAVIITESGLSFLGLGVQPPTASWGNMVSDGVSNIYSVWWLCVFPSVAIVIFVMALNLIGDGLRDAMDIRNHT